MMEGESLLSCQGYKIPGCGVGHRDCQGRCGARACFSRSGGSAHAYLLAFSIYKGKLQVIILNGFVCPVGG